MRHPLTFFLSTGGAVLLWPHAVSALEVNYPSILPIDSATTLPELIKVIFNFSLGASALLLFAVISWAGILFLVSAGDPMKQRRAKERLGSAALGSILLLTSYLAANIFAPELLILKPAGIPGISLTKTPLFNPQCSDGIDNDGDSKIDWDGKGDPARKDPDCQNATDESEFLVECSDGIDNDGDGKIDFPADAQCKELSGISESFEYECVASNDPGSGVGLPEITETYPLVTRSKQALATLDTIRTLLEDIQIKSFQIADVQAQSVCQSSLDEHGSFETLIGDCSGDGEDHGHCAEADWWDCHEWTQDCTDQDACVADCPAADDLLTPDVDENADCVSDCPSCANVEPCVDEHFHDEKNVLNHDWSCHRNGGEWTGGGQNEDIGALPPTSAPTLAFINETIDLIERDEADAKGIEKTLEELRGSSDPVKSPPYTLIIPRDEDKTDDGKPFLLSLKRIEDDLKNIRDTMNTCSRTPNEQVFTFKNIVARGVDAPKPCEDAGNCPEDNDFACLFLPETK